MTVQAAGEKRHGAKEMENGLRAGGGNKKAGLEGVKREDLACLRQGVRGDTEKNLKKTGSSSLQSFFNFVPFLLHPPVLSSESILQVCSVQPPHYSLY